MKACHTCLQIIKEGNLAIKLCDIFCDVSTPSEDLVSVKDKLADCIPEFLLGSIRNTFLCQPCVAAINAAYKFRQQCLETQFKIHGYLQQMPVGTEMNIEEIALYYQRLEIVANGGDPTKLDLEGDTVPNMLGTVKGESSLHNEGNVGAKQHQNDQFLEKFSSPNLHHCIKQEPNSGDDSSNLDIDEKQDADELSASDLNGKETFTCTLCEYIATSYSRFCYHTQLHENEKIPDKCNHCDFTSTDRPKLVKHIKSHSNPKAGSFYVCTSCDFRTYVKKDMINHSFQHNFTESCHLCDWQFPNRTELATHMKSHAKGIMLKCTVCNFRSGTQASLQRHLRSHNKNFKFTCNLCPYKTKTSK